MPVASYSSKRRGRSGPSWRHTRRCRFMLDSRQVAWGTVEGVASTAVTCSSSG